jgi:hypothetical protein
MLKTKPHALKNSLSEKMPLEKPKEPSKKLNKP